MLTEVYTSVNFKMISIMGKVTSPLPTEEPTKVTLKMAIDTDKVLSLGSTEIRTKETG